MKEFESKQQSPVDTALQEHDVAAARQSSGSIAGTDAVPPQPSPRPAAWWRRVSAMQWAAACAVLAIVGMIVIFVSNGHGDMSSASTQTFTANGVSFKMVRVEGGTFTMGATSEQGSDADSDEKPAHSVTLSSYYIGETEVTQALWYAVMGAKPTSSKSWTTDYGLGDEYPAYYISWKDCETFIAKLNSITGKNFRFPTEAEWEYAARGGSKSRGYKYSGSNAIDEVAWYRDNSGSETHPVKGKSPNELGLYDMSGNVYEWCQDWYASYGSSSGSEGSVRVIRGGSWDLDAGFCRVSIRNYCTPSYSHYYFGLRLAL